MTISAVVHTYNEENNIRACLESLGFADEVVVVDNESEDQTRRIAAEMGARVEHFAGRYGCPEPARVYGLTRLTGDWVFILDADERATPQLAEEILTVTRDPLADDGYWVAIRNIHFGQWLRHGGLYPDWHLRLFRREKGSYPEVGLHRGISVDGSLGRVYGDILHYSYRDIAHYFDKFNTYTRLEAERIVNQGRLPTGYDMLIKPLHRFVKSYIFKGGLADGLPGFLYHAFSAAYVMASEVKAWDAYRQLGRTLPVGSTLFKRRRGQRQNNHV